MIPPTGIFIVSYAKDIPYLSLCLASTQKFCTGFSGVTLLVPQQEGNQFAELVKKYGVTFREYDRQPDPVKWHIEAQKQKCYADKWCPDYAVTAHVDSDCIFSDPTTPEIYFRGDKPILPYESYAHLPPEIPWRQCTSDALGIDVRLEFMRRHPELYWKGHYKQVRNRVEAIHGVSFDEFMMSRNPDYPWGISEHNLMGAFAWHDHVWHGYYRWIDCEREKLPPNNLIQFWSLSPPDREQSLPNGGRGVPMDVARKLGIA